MFRNGRRPRIISTLAALAFAILIVGAVAASRWVWLWEPGEATNARLAVAGGRYDVASQAVDRWLIAVPNNSEAHLLKGRVMVAMNRLAEADYELRQAQNLGQPQADLALLRALIASKAGRIAQAQPALERGLRRAPSS